MLAVPSVQNKRADALSAHAAWGEATCPTMLLANVKTRKNWLRQDRFMVVVTVATVSAVEVRIPA